MKEKFYESYFPEYDQIDLNMDSLLTDLTNELKANAPTPLHSPSTQKNFGIIDNLHPEEISKLENYLHKLDAPNLLEIIQTVENWNLKLLADYREISTSNFP